MNPVELGLPHREPFIFVDEVVELVPGQSARGVKVFPPEAPFFQGHFPGEPLVPGVLLTEALAQVAGIAVGEPGVALRLTAIKSMKFLRPVRPSETVELVAKKMAAAGGLYQFAVTASVNGTPCADGSVVLSR